MNRFEDMRTFIAVVETGSVSAAAERLRVAKSAVSRRLSDLEARLGARLLNRTTRRLSLTEAGREFYQRAVCILADVDEAESAVSTQQAALHGNLRLAAPLSFGVHHLAPALDDFINEHTELRLDIDFNDRHVNLIEEGFDLAVRVGALEDSSLIARRLAPVRRVTCGSPDYLRRHGTPGTPRDLRSHHGLMYSNVTQSGYWQYRSSGGEAISVEVPIRLRANNGDALLAAATAGLGLVVSPTFIAYQAIERGQLVPVLTDYAPPELGMYAVYPPGRHVSRRVRALIDFLVTRFGDNPYWDRCLSSD